MPNTTKIPCGGFYLGDGLTMEGDTLKSLGGAYIKVVPDEESPESYKIADDSPLNYETAMKYDGFIFIKLYDADEMTIIPLALKNAGIVGFTSCLIFPNMDVIHYIGIEVHEDNSIHLTQKEYTLTPTT